jgi:hypothetical protein
MENEIRASVEEHDDLEIYVGEWAKIPENPEGWCEGSGEWIKKPIEILDTAKAGRVGKCRTGGQMYTRTMTGWRRRSDEQPFEGSRFLPESCMKIWPWDDVALDTRGPSPLGKLPPFSGPGATTGRTQSKYPNESNVPKPGLPFDESPTGRTNRKGPEIQNFPPKKS